VQILAIALLTLASAGSLYQWLGTRRRARACVLPGEMIDVRWTAPPRRRRRQRRARAVILEAGIAASSLSWAHVQPKVAAFARTCAYDRAGLAWSVDPRPSTPRQHRRRSRVRSDEDVDAAAIRAGRPFVWVFCICVYAARHPERIAGLVFLDPPAASEWRQPSRRQARLLSRGIRLSHFGGLMARIGVVRACLSMLTGGAPRVPRTLIKGLGSVATAKLQHLVDEVRKLPPDVHPLVQEHWCQPKCFRAMADHLRVLQEAAAFVGGLSALPAVPLVVISSGQLPANQIDEHRELARLSSDGRHVVAAGSGHWIQFDEPDVVVDAIRDVISRG
jgi:pimeloyl-ACP methyl ester carboxylesterase